MFTDEYLDQIADRVIERILPKLVKLVPQANIERRWLSLEQAAHYLGTTYEGIRGMVRRKTLPVHYRESKPCIDRLAIDAYMESCRDERVA